ncbi:MAG: hypothetical protein ACLQHF_12180 [Terracidiphilus sp.]
MWISVVGAGFVWSWAYHLRDYLSAGTGSPSQYIQTNLGATFVSAVGLLVWPIATWQRLNFIGASELGATQGVVGLVLLWAVLFILHISMTVAVILLVVILLPLAIPKGNPDRERAES